MTSLILLWKEDDRSDIIIAKDGNGNPLLFEFKRAAMTYASEHYGFGSGRSTIDLYNYNVVEL